MSVQDQGPQPPLILFFLLQQIVRFSLFRLIAEFFGP